MFFIKKFFKILFIFAVIFAVFLYILGSCSECPDEYKPKEEKITPVYTELAPDEYQKEMDRLVNNPPITQLSFRSPVLQAHAESTLEEALEKYYNFWENTGFFLYDVVHNFDDMKIIFSDNDNYPVEPAEPKESVTVPLEYKFYGKNRVVYKSGAYEIITCNVITNGPVSNKSKTGTIKYTRTNNLGQFTQFGFDISLSTFSKNFSSKNGFILIFYGLDSYSFGLVDYPNSSLTSAHRAYFEGSSVNSLRQYNINSNTSVSIDKILVNNSYDDYPNHFTISSTVSNDYQFSQSVNNYYADFNYWKFSNVYYNNNAGDTITKNNINNYTEYGYTYNNVTNSIEFDPNLYADFFDLNIKPKLEAEYDLIFSKFPDINAKFDDTDIKYNNLIEIMNEINKPVTTTTTLSSGTAPVGTGDIYIQLTFPEIYFETYPKLTTEPAVSLTTVSFSDYSDSFPENIKHGVEWWVSQATGFLQSSELFGLLLAVISVGIAIYIFL